MHYIIQDDYNYFYCLADYCEESCCNLWQIYIDEDSLKRYEQLPGEFGEYLRSQIDFEEGVFKQNHGSCAMLNDSGLCKLQLEKGEESLCETCRAFPRHVEEYDGVREYSLSLSCPKVANDTIRRKDSISFIEYDDTSLDDFEENEFDFFLFTKLCDAREIIYKLIDQSSLSLDNVMSLTLEMSLALQKCLERDNLFLMDEIIEIYDTIAKSGIITDRRSTLLNDKLDISTESVDFDDKNMFSELFNLEFLHDNWAVTISDAFDYNKENNADFDPFSGLSDSLIFSGRNLLKSLIYTYFCGSVYDDLIYAKAALSVYMVRWFYLLYKKSAAFDDDICALAKSVYCLAREIEHSDNNLIALDELFSKKITN